MKSASSPKEGKRKEAEGSGGMDDCEKQIKKKKKKPNQGLDAEGSGGMDDCEKQIKKKKKKSNQGLDAEGSGGMDDCEKQIKKKKKKSNQGLDASGSSVSSPPATASASGAAFCSFPMSRVWRLVRGECIGVAAAEIRTTADAVFIINKASEMFLEQLTEDAHAFAKKEQKNYISYNHMCGMLNSSMSVLWMKES